MVQIESVLTLLFIVENAARRNPATGPNTLELGNFETNIHSGPVDSPDHEVTNPRTDRVMDVIGQSASALDRDRVMRQPALGPECSLKDFCSHYSDSFDGTGDYISAENWVNDMEELLKVTSCTKDQNVIYMAYKLSGEAKRW